MLRGSLASLLYGAALALLGSLYAIGLRARWSELTYAMKRRGVGRALNSGIAGGALLIVEKLLTPRIVGKAPA